MRAAWLLGFSLAPIGLLKLIISSIAIGCNRLFSDVFDALQRRMGFHRTMGVRPARSVLFEIGLLLTVVPLAAWWLSVGLWKAFLLDIGFALFFLLCTFFFNLAYDHLRARFVA